MSIHQHEGSQQKLCTQILHVNESKIGKTILVSRDGVTLIHDEKREGRERRGGMWKRETEREREVGKGGR